MPAITLRSTQNALRSPCDHAGDQASITLRSSAITLHVSPHTPGGSQAPLSALGGRALPRPGREEEKRRSETAPQPQHAANARLPASHVLGIALDEQLSASVLAWCGFRREITVSGDLVTSYVDTVQTRLTAEATNAVISAISGRRPHDGKSRKGFTRALLQHLSHWLRERRARETARET
jgi:hypothetical protein